MTRAFRFPCETESVEQPALVTAPGGSPRDLLRPARVRRFLVSPHPGPSSHLILIASSPVIAS